MLDTTFYSLVLSIFVGVATGYLGSLMVLEKMALVGDALVPRCSARLGYWDYISF